MPSDPRQDAPFTVEEIRRFATEADAIERERAGRLRTEAGKRLIRASRTVVAKDGATLTIVDGDVLDALVAIEAATETPDTTGLRAAAEQITQTALIPEYDRCPKCDRETMGHLK